MSTPRRLWIDKTGQPVITTTANGERNARRWGWTPARAVPSAPVPAPSVVPEAAVEAGARAGMDDEAATDDCTWDADVGVEDGTRDGTRDDYRHRARVILTAALPHLTPAPSATREKVTHAVAFTPVDVDLEALTAYFDGTTDEMVLRVRRNHAPKETDRD